MYKHKETKFWQTGEDEGAADPSATATNPRLPPRQTGSQADRKPLLQTGRQTGRLQQSVIARVVSPVTTGLCLKNRTLVRSEINAPWIIHFRDDTAPIW